MINNEKMLKIANNGHPFLNLKTDIDICGFVDAFITATDDSRVSEKIAVRSIEKMLMRACISMIIQNKDESRHNFHELCSLLRANGEFRDGRTRFEQLFENYYYENGKNTLASTQFANVKLASKSMYNDALVALLDRLTYFEILER